MTELLLPEIERLADGGAAFALIAANTRHIVFDQLQRRSPIPMISIVEATADVALELGLKKRGLSLVVPSPKEREYVHAWASFSTA